jgi:hexosaminidase
MALTDPLSVLIPAPRHWRPAPGSLAPARLVRVRWETGEGAAAADDGVALAALAAAFLAPALGRTLDGHGGPPGADEAAAALRLRIDSALAPEHYRLDIAPAGLTLSAAAQAGFARGLATIYQLCAGRADTDTIACGVITDSPAFAWRGLLLDSGRHFQPVERVLAVIDRLAVYRFNVLHWHLTEDQGWRLEIPGLPRLTSVGAWRERQQGDGTHGGFYDADDVRRVIDHATARGITVVPEIEMPGHCQAALAAYPELSCTGGPFAVQTQWGVFPDIYCAGNDAVFAFLETVLAHVLELFPSPFIHVGGDEAPRDRWRACPRCQARLAEHGLRDESELQSWFIRRLGRWLADRGRRLVGWDEILDGGLAGSLPGAVVQSWRGQAGAVAAARAGHDTIVSPTSHAYFDYDPGVLDLARVHAFRPVPPELTADAATRVLGGAANLWTEYAPADRLDRQLFPRLPAMAEALWTAPEPRDTPALLARLRRHDAVWRALGVTPGEAGRPLTVKATYDAAHGHHELTVTTQGTLAAAVAGRTTMLTAAMAPLSSIEGYMPDGRPEDVRMPGDGVWPASLAITAGRARVAPSPDGRIVRVRFLVDGEPCGAPACVELRGHRALGRAVTLTGACGRGEATLLTDGVHGTWRHDDGRWCGVEGADLDARVDLEAPSPIAIIGVRCLQDANRRVFLPREVRFFLSDDGHDWRPAGACGHNVDDRVQDKVIHAFSVRPDAVARYVRVLAIGRGGCPDWHPDAGGAAWILADEITVD